MNALWSYFWPVFALSLVVGTVAGLIAWRSASRRWALLAAGAVAMLGVASLWHGPLGGGDRLAGTVERIAARTLAYYEMPEVTARLQRGPLTRRMVLSGRADEFQRGEIVRILNGIPGVSGAFWSPRAGMPLLVEGSVVGLIGFLLGCLVAYGASLRRRGDSDWS
ncbi:MAG: hypothetical protein WKF52_05490 [Sphingomicrobium sp.]